MDKLYIIQRVVGGVACGYVHWAANGSDRSQVTTEPDRAMVFKSFGAAQQYLEDFLDPSEFVVTIAA